MKPKTAKVTKTRIVFAGSCFFAGCRKTGQHSHRRFNRLGWDLAHPFWRVTLPAAIPSPEVFND